jgi:hypothetical protein
MGEWLRFHLDETITALAIPEGGRFLVRVREPAEGNRRPIQFYRWNLREAQKAADQLVQAYYPHDCDEQNCGRWRKTDS